MNRLVRMGVVAALCAGAAVAWSAPGRSRIQHPAPGDTPERRPAFRWSAAPDATKYLLRLTRNGAPYLEKWTKKTQWAPRFDLPEGVYEVRVITYDNVEYGQWSAKIKFRRVFAPALASVNGLRQDGGNVTIAAGDGIEIETVASNKTIVIHAIPVAGEQIVNYSVITEKIADGAVTTLKLENGSVTSNKLAPDAVRPSALAREGAGNGQFLRYNGTIWAPASLALPQAYAEGALGSGPLATEVGSIAIGNGNEAHAASSVSCGGQDNRVALNAGNAGVFGGLNNEITGSANFSTIIGGRLNMINKEYCFAAGRQAMVTNIGAFVWADSTTVPAGSWGTNTVLFQASGGVRFESATPTEGNHRVEWKPGDASWQFSSDRNLKEGLAPVSGATVLDKLAALPVAEWNYKGHDRRHIGVMAQDFHAAFPLAGSTDTMIDSADLHGVTVSAIQGLYESLQAEKARADALEKRLAALEAGWGR